MKAKKVIAVIGMTAATGLVWSTFSQNVGRTTVLANSRYSSALQKARGLAAYSSIEGRILHAWSLPARPTLLSQDSSRWMAPDPLDASAAFYLNPTGSIERVNKETGESEDLSNPSTGQIVAVAATRVGAVFAISSLNQLYAREYNGTWRLAGTIDEPEAPLKSLSLTIHAKDPMMVLIAGHSLHVYNAYTDEWRTLRSAPAGAWITKVAVNHVGELFAGFDSGCYSRGEQTGERFDGSEVEWTDGCLPYGPIIDFAFDFDVPKRVVVAQAGADPDGPSVLRISEDRGGTWRVSTSAAGYELPEVPIRHLSTDDGTFYAVTPIGVFVSKDAGGHWMVETGTLGQDVQHFVPVADSTKRRFYLAAQGTIHAYDNASSACTWTLKNGNVEERYISVGWHDGSHYRSVALSGSRTNCSFVPAFCKLSPPLIRVTLWGAGHSTPTGDVNSTVEITVYDNPSPFQRARGLAIAYNKEHEEQSQMPVAVVQGGKGNGTTACALAHWVDVNDPTPVGTQGILNFMVHDTNPGCDRTFYLTIIACGLNDSNITLASKANTRSYAPSPAPLVYTPKAVCHDTGNRGPCRD